MATVITISESGKVTITVHGVGGDCPPSDLIRRIDLARAVHALQQGQDHTDQLLRVLDSKVEAIYRLVRVPKSLLITVGTPYEEGT